MIHDHQNHSANERTYLAWVSLSVAIMAFGFIIERFELFLFQLNKAMGDKALFQPSVTAEWAGLGLFLLGLFLIINATWRFYQIKKMIDSEQQEDYPQKWPHLFLSSILIATSLFLIANVSWQIIGHQP